MRRSKKKNERKNDLILQKHLPITLRNQFDNLIRQIIRIDFSDAVPVPKND